ncbi:hypothetical protein SMICM17S_06701 [Streptomyces microflavus]
MPDSDPAAKSESGAKADTSKALVVAASPTPHADILNFVKRTWPGPRRLHRTFVICEDPPPTRHRPPSDKAAATRAPQRRHRHRRRPRDHCHRCLVPAATPYPQGIRGWALPAEAYREAGAERMRESGEGESRACAPRTARPASAHAHRRPGLATSAPAPLPPLAGHRGGAVGRGGGRRRGGHLRWRPNRGACSRTDGRVDVAPSAYPSGSAVAAPRRVLDAPEPDVVGSGAAVSRWSGRSWPAPRASSRRLQPGRADLGAALTARLHRRVPCSSPSTWTPRCGPSAGPRPSLRTTFGPGLSLSVRYGR